MQNPVTRRVTIAIGKGQKPDLGPVGKPRAIEFCISRLASLKYWVLGTGYSRATNYLAQICRLRLITNSPATGEDAAPVIGATGFLTSEVTFGFLGTNSKAV